MSLITRFLITPAVESDDKNELEVEHKGERGMGRGQEVLETRMEVVFFSSGAKHIRAVPVGDDVL